MRHTTKHFKSTRKSTSVDIKKEVVSAESPQNARTVIPLTLTGIHILSQSYPLVDNIAALDTLITKLDSSPDSNEFGFSPIFSPTLVDETCQRGIFPLSLSIGGGYYVYAPKLHHFRSLTQLNLPVEGFPNDKGKFIKSRLQVSKKYLKEQKESTRNISFDVFINRKEDIASVLSLIHAQHGENWLCRALRACFISIFLNSDKYKTKIVIIAIRRHIYNSNNDKNSLNKETTRDSKWEDGDPTQEGDLVAAEIGYIVGDIYCSATGAYSTNGAGTLQLAVTGEIMRSVGCKVWDLGMSMEYKDNLLGCVPIPRMQWLDLLRKHTSDKSVSESINKLLHERYRNGVPVRDILSQSEENQVK